MECGTDTECFVKSFITTLQPQI